MANVCKSDVQRIYKDIRQLREQNKNDNEIRQILKLELRTYQRYNKKINEEDKQIWYSITKDQVGTELSRLKESLEHTYQVAKELSEDKEYDKRLDALEKKDESRLNIVRLLIYGPKFVQVDFRC